MSRRVGTFNSSCKECKREGKVEVFWHPSKAGAVCTKDYINHAEDCSLFVREQPRHLKKKAWRGQEKRANALVGARETLMSGAVNEDGDGRLFHGWRVECKRTDDSLIAVTNAVWKKLVRGALAADEEPLLHLENPSGRWCVVRLDWFIAYDTDGELDEDSLLANYKGIRIASGCPQPQLLSNLDPPGVVMMEAHFKTLKERADADSAEYLRSTAE